ncbi:MAG TPA: HD domain-containing phosphohydrolase [Verrucomicrobiae bacterium]|jgi:response regulator RpfG family c-di-GMP phosphodiesterase|nr:HD domain-containing phosphohydrolase [Verrucomicrobiae bacterium]
MNEPVQTPEAAAEMPRILIIDDEEIILVALYETLRRENYEVVTTSDPETALAELKKKEFAVIISDQRMPTMMGLELLAQARQIQPLASRILITAVLSLDTVIEAINKGEIFRFIVKPWLREELLVTIKNAVQRYDLTRQNVRLNAATQSMNEQLVELNRSLEQQVKLVAQQNQQLTEMNRALEENLLRSMELSLHMMQTFYPTLGNQARRVAQLCRSMAQAANLTPEERRILDGAALLHDIGMVGVPRQLIRRWQDNPNALDPAERALIQQHPILGQELTAFGNGSDQIGKVIRAHHEQFDGTGYPDELAGENIPWLARLLAVAIAFESSNLGRGDAVEEIKLRAGTSFDPEAVRALLKAIPLAPLPRKEKEIMLSELRPGMVLARGIYTANGLLLVPEGQQLNATYIEKLLNHNRVQPITQSLVVYC